MYKLEWPYPIEWDKQEVVSADILVLGGGIAGCWAAIAAAKEGQKVVMVDKGAIARSGANGSGCDHWESAATNPCSKVTPEELAQAFIDDQDGYNNGISHYIECREGYDRILDLEKMGGKVRDTEDEFKGADFRDEKTKFLFAYDYENKYTLRVWGTTFKPALYNECKRLGVNMLERTMATSLLTEGGKQGNRIVGAMGVNCRTGKLLVFKAKATILAMSRPSRVWLFSAGLPGLSEFRPLQCTGDGHAMGWRAGAEFTMMEKSIRAQYSAAGRSYPAYGTGNNHNTWFACTMVDDEGKEIPYADRDGRILNSVDERYRPAPGQKFFLMGGTIDNPKYEITGPEILPAEQLLKMGYKLPFYADLSRMPEMERKAIWGLMVGQEGKTQVPIFRNYTEAGFDPEKHLLQSYGSGWMSAEFLPNERQLFGLPGGIFVDWNLKTNLEGLYAAGDQIFASDCHGHAAATGHYAGRHAASYAKAACEPTVDWNQVDEEKDRIYAPLKNERGVGWKEINMAVAKIMQNYCGEIKREELLRTGLEVLKDMEVNVIKDTYARNPHELVRTLEVFDIITVAQLIIYSCLSRKASSKPLSFIRADYPEVDPPSHNKFITVRQFDGHVLKGEYPLDYYGSLKDNYEKNNKAYIEGRK